MGSDGFDDVSERDRFPAGGLTAALPLALALIFHLAPTNELFGGSSSSDRLRIGMSGSDSSSEESASPNAFRAAVLSLDLAGLIVLLASGRLPGAVCSTDSVPI